MSPVEDKSLHIAMYPWFAMGHITPFLHLANKLAEKGHKITFFLPLKTQPKLASLNHHPHLITFIPVPVPRVDGLPEWAETTNDVPPQDRPLIMIAMDSTRDTIDSHLAQLKPDLVFFDFAHWLPGLARKYQAKSVFYCASFMMPAVYFFPQARNKPINYALEEEDLVHPPPGFPDGIRLAAHEARAMAHALKLDFGGEMTWAERSMVAYKECDAIAIKTCREIEGPLCEFATMLVNKPVFLAGPSLPGHPNSRLDEDIDGWLKGFGHATVIYCALGSECTLEKDQFQELVLGLELTGKPFLAALKPPINCKTIESALPEGFLERTRDRGMIHDGWVQQQLILNHPSVGCFVTHSGPGSFSEAIMSKCQMVLLPQAVDQFLIARLMSCYMKVGVEVEKRDYDGFFTREAVGKAINLVMEEESEVGKEVRANHAKWRELLSKEGLEEYYISQLVQGLHGLLGPK
ncbi:hypothetical protein Cgig2_002392 [Carnegiea gigantea]|uniref:Glycosyltransferase n=1 Tax=Carnegiea gigantea TaxID=171969 RepID=A0A9Q1KUD9_9CARY|nr:hypothetical protein Cgig2_002392 [Carnegiea gigantea]